jgi:hypothetical protein
MQSFMIRQRDADIGLGSSILLEPARIIAVQRKLLLLVFSLWKSDQEYLEKCA